MAKKIVGLVLFLFFFVNAAVLYPADDLSLGVLTEKVLRQNPKIEAARLKYEAAKAYIPQAGSLADPRFEFEYNTMIPNMISRMNNGGSADPMRVFGWSQEVPFPTKLITRAQIAAKQAQIIYQDYKEQEREIIAQTKRLYADLAFIYKSVDIVKENKALLDQLAKTAATQYSVGKASQQDALKAQLEIAKMDNELIMLESRRQVTQAKLNVLLNQDASAELGAPALAEKAQYNFDLSDLNILARQNRPELQAYRLMVERADKTYSLAKQEYLPDFMFKYEKMERDSQLKDWAGMVGVTIPLWFWQKQNFNVKQMRSELKAMQAEYKNKENLVLLEIKDAYSNLEALKSLAVLFKTAYLPQAEQTLKSSLIGYESDQIDFLSLLDSQRMFLEFKLDYYKSLVDLEVAFADLESAVGIELK